MKTAYITRYAAIGDHIHSSHLPRMLKEREGFDRVIFEYNFKGIPVYQGNPFIDEHIIFDPHAMVYKDYPVSILQKRHAFLTNDFKATHIDLMNSIERAYIAMETQSEYYLSSQERRAMYGGHNYYDQVMEFAGYPQHKGMVGELYFSEEHERIVGVIYQKFYKDKFVLIANLSGTSKHKILLNAEKIIKEFLARHEDAVCLTMGDDNVRDYLEFEGERIFRRAGVYPFKQSMLMTKYADCVIGAESGLMVAATLLGAPTIQLMTAASIKNHGGDFANDYSLQSPAPCSPCHKGPYEYIGCPTFTHLGLDYPVCVKFNETVVLNRLEEVYSDRSRARKETREAALSAV
jgi:ADP-heptose:LPS heptosyltransferase